MKFSGNYKVLDLCVIVIFSFKYFSSDNLDIYKNLA